MKKIIFIALFAIIALGSFATKPKVLEAQNTSFLLRSTLKVKTPATANVESGVHLSGTITSSCGDVWDYTYDCYSGCTLSGTASNFMDMVRAANNACGTSVTEINLSW